MIGPEWAQHLREVERIAANHEAMVQLLEELAAYAYYLRDKHRPAVVRSVGHGIRDRIHQAFERLEWKQ